MNPFADKNFLRVCGKPLIQWQIEMMMRAGFREIAVVGGRHNLDALREAVSEIDCAGAAVRGDWASAANGAREVKNSVARGAAVKARGANCITCIEQKDLEEGMAGAVLACEKWISGSAFLVVSSNDIVESGIFEALKSAMKEHRDADGLIVAKRARSYFPGGYLKVGARGVIKDIIEKPGEGNEPSDLVNLVFHYHSSPEKLFSALKKAKSSRDDRYEVALSSLMRGTSGKNSANVNACADVNRNDVARGGGVKFYAVPYDGAWQPVKYPWHLLNVWQTIFAGIRGAKNIKRDYKQNLERDVKQNLKRDERPIISKKSVIAKSAVIRGKVVIEDGVRVFDNAVIQGPAYIGKNCVIANNALVRESHLGDGCVAGYSTEIARSFLDNSVWTHSNYIGDSVIGANSSFGSGTVTGNLRLDEKTIMASAGDCGASGSVADGANVGTSGAQKVDTGLTKLGAIVGEGVRVGINVSLMPGIRIGSNSFIGAGITLAQDIPDDMFVTGKWELTIRENKVKLSPSARQAMMDKLTKSPRK